MPVPGSDPAAGLPVGAALQVSREQVLGFRRRMGALDERLPSGADSMRRAAWAGLTDSGPRAALLQLHARVAGTTPSALDDPTLVQVWGPRFSVYVVAEQDRAVFTVGRTPVDEARRALAADAARRLDDLLEGREMPVGEAARALGEHHHLFRYASTTGRVLVRWDGARQPTVRTVPAPEVSPDAARRELARRYLHVLGPGTPTGFGDWAGLRTAPALATFESLLPDLVPVRTDVGEAWVLADDETALRGPTAPTAPARLLPSGDTFTLFHGVHRALVVPDAGRRAQLWTPRVWPGAVLVDGDVAGTWRRAGTTVTVRPWAPLSPAARAAVEHEATSLPLPLPDGSTPVTVRWDT